jgi:hypothetical protein
MRREGAAMPDKQDWMGIVGTATATAGGLLGLWAWGSDRLRARFRAQSKVEEDLPEVRDTLRAHLKSCDERGQKMTEALHRIEVRLERQDTKLEYLANEQDRLRRKEQG